MEEDDRYSVQITEENGTLADLQRSWRTAEFSAEDGIGPLDSLHQAGDAVVAVVRMDDTGVTVLGSGAMVGPGLILTATHVLNEFPSDGGSPVFMTFLPQAARAWLPKDWLALAREHKYVAGCMAESDIALVSCTLNSDARPERRLTLTPMEVVLPLIGERLWALGFRHQGLSDSSTMVTPLVSSGLVTRAFPFGRDERLPSPCLEIEMETVGGMSGGAVVNAAGRLVGIVSSSFEGGPSYVTLLWDAIRLEVESAVPRLTGGKRISLLCAKRLGLAKLEGDISRDPWGDVTFRLSDEGAKLFEESVPASEREAARVSAMSSSQIEEFLDERGMEMEELVSSAAIRKLQVASLVQVRKFLGAADIPAADLKLIVRHDVEDLEGVENLTVTASHWISEEKLGLDFHFEIRHMVWTVEIPTARFSEDTAHWLTHFAHVESEGDRTTLLLVQRPCFKGTIVFEPNSGEFSDVAIIASAILRKRSSVRDQSRQN